MASTTSKPGEAACAPLNRPIDLASFLEGQAFKLRALATLIGQANDLQEKDYAGIAITLDEWVNAAEKAVDSHDYREDELPVTRRVLEILAEAACYQCSYFAEGIKAGQGIAPLEERYHARTGQVSRCIKTAFDRARNGTQAVLPLMLVEALELTLSEEQ